MARWLKALSLTLALAALNLITTSCSSGYGGAQIRMVNAIPDSPPVDVYVNGTKVFTNLSFGAAQPNTTPARYLSAATGTTTFQGYATGNITNPIAPEGMVSFVGSTQYTVIAVGLELNNAAPIAFADNNTVPTADNVEYRIINVSPSSPAAGLDVYFVPPGTDITTYTPQITVLGNGQASQYQSLPVLNSGYAIIMTAHLSKTALITQLSTAPAESITTLVILDNPGGNNGMSTAPLILNDLE
jgi:hypothetical protein